MIGLKQLFFENSIRGKLLSGSILLFGSISLENISRFIRNMILARILSPADFGMMAIVLSTMSISEALAEIGVRQSVIQNKRGSEYSFKNVAWWFASLRTGCLFILAFFMAPLIARFYQQPELIDLLRVAFLTILFRGLVSPNIYILEKDMKYGKYVIITQGAGIIGVLTAIIIAEFFLPTVWALVIGNVTEGLLQCILSFTLVPFIPSFRFNYADIKSLISFARGMFGTSILAIMLLQLDILVLGRILPMEQVGMYSLARTLAEIPLTLFSKIMSPMALSFFSKIQDVKERINSTLLVLIKNLAMFGLPFFAFMIVFSKSILSVAYGPSYSSIALIFSILCIFSFIRLFPTVFVELLFSIGKPHLHRSIVLVRAIFSILLIYPFVMQFGLFGAAILLLLGMCLTLSIQLYIIRKVLGIHCMNLLKSCLPAVRIAFIVSVLSIIYLFLFNVSNLFNVAVGIFFYLTVITISLIWSGLFRGKSISTVFLT